MAEPLYVSCVDGKPVARFSLGGRGGARGQDPIGAVRGEGRAWVYHPEIVVMIAAPEVEAFGRIYERAIHEGNLTRRTAADYAAQVKAQKQREADALQNGAPSAPGGAP